MSVASGTRLGAFEIRGLLGVGGMGEVYRAHDTKLNRDVAIKVLPPELSREPDRLARFTREAQVLASLNHPNIAQLYGVEDAAGAYALVMELVEGPTLADRLAAGRMPLDEIISVARQTAEAIEAAHDQGVIHRDLKPANIKVRPDGTVKVLDFGLAKALDPAASGAGSDPMNSPTLTGRATQAGFVLGTAAYMAPEQAKGRPVDRRADIWSFGVVLFEMLSGRHLFQGETVSEVLAAVIKDDVRWEDVPESTPPALRRLLERCLDRDPKSRLRDVGEARLALANLPRQAGALARREKAETPPGGPPSRRARAVAWLTLPLALALAASLYFLARVPAPVHPSIVRFEIPAPDKAALSLIVRPAIDVAEDGSTVAFVAATDGVSRIYLRKMTEVEIRPLAGTEGASNPAFSPDGKSVAFFADNKLKTITVDGSVTVLADANDDPRGIAWVDGSTLVYAPSAIGGLYQVSANGGAAKQVTTVDTKKGERTHRWPSVLPTGKVVLFTVGVVGSPDNYDSATIEALTLATGERRTVLRNATMARYVPAGHLVFARAGILYAVAFDPGRLASTGAPLPVVQGVAGDVTTGAAQFACSGDGTLVYVPGSAMGSLHRLVWADRSGKFAPVDLQPGVYYDPRLSPDGTRVALVNGTSGTADVWIYEFARKTFTRLTFEGADATPIWSADSKTVYYSRVMPNGATAFMRKPADGSREAEEVGALPARAYLAGVDAGRDGDRLIVDYIREPRVSSDIVSVKLGSDKPEFLVSTHFDEYGSALSPDRRWLAYQSNETGRYEVYVREVGGSGARWQISTTGGEEPRWSGNGTELFYRNDTRLMVVSINARPTFEASAARVVFDGVYNFRSDTGVSFSVDPRAARFLMLRLADDTDPRAAVRVVLHWMDDVRRQEQ